MKAVRSFVLSALLALGACTDGLRGVPMKGPERTGKIVASVSTSEPGGLLVFWNGKSITHREVHKRGGGGAWIAGSEAEASGLLTLRYAPQTDMSAHNDSVHPIARIIGVPRRVLPTTVVFLDGYAFEVPEIPFG